MKTEEFLGEIDYTAGTGAPLEKESVIIQNSVIIGDIDLRDVWLYKLKEQELFFIVVNDKIGGLVLLLNNRIRMISNPSGTPGLVTSIIGFLTTKLKRKLTISKTEQLSLEGFRWLKSLILKNGRGLITITDQTGQLPDITQLEKEWTSAMTGLAGNTEIFFESNMSRKLIDKKDALIMNCTFFIGDKDIL